MPTELCKCPNCHKIPKLSDITDNVKAKVNSDFAIFDSEKLDLNYPVDSEENMKLCHFDKGDALTFTIRCPNCTVEIYSLVKNEFDPEKNELAIRNKIIEEWNKMDGDIELDCCPKCKQKMSYDEDEFIYPVEFAPIGDYTTQFNYTASCDAGGVGCGFSIQFKANRREAKNVGEKLWRNLYI